MDVSFMNCIGNPEVLYRGRGYSNRSVITLQGCTSSHMFPPLSVCTRHVLGRLQAKANVGVDHYLTNRTSLWSRFIAYSGSIHEEIRPEFRSQPQTMCTGSGTPNGRPAARPRAYRNTAHPSGQRCVRPPAYYKHKKLLATPGQRTRGV